MIKKLLLIIVILAIVMTGLQLFGGRDFTQMGTAWDKYASGGDLGSFMSDVGSIFSGGKINESVFPDSKYNELIMYRWKDELGEVHVSERKPNIDNYEEIRLGDMKFQIQEGMTEEEIKAVLQKGEQD